MLAIYSVITTWFPRDSSLSTGMELRECACIINDFHLNVIFVELCNPRA